MINIDDRVFAIVFEAVKAVAPEAQICDPHIASPSIFPCVTVQLADNATTPSVIGSRNKARYARITYQVEVYSNKDNGKKSECYKIMAAISDALILRNFQQIVMTPTPNLKDASIYRLTARFQVIADNKNKTYRR